ncbi:hypothetical protein BH11PSE4_BH11PSE4_04120 [soil metagenome]
MTASAQPAEQTLIARLTEWLQRRREIGEMNQLDASEFARIAGEIGVAPQELDLLVRRGPHAADEMPKVLRALGFDEEAIARIQAPQRQDMERACSLCQHKAECGNDLAKGSVAEHYESYCNNTDAIAELARSVR